jgi:hypothetical protein
MLTEDYIIKVYCLVDDMLKKLEKIQLRQRGPSPKLSDAEVITMEIVGESKGLDKDKSIHRYFRDHWIKIVSPSRQPHNVLAPIRESLGGQAGSPKKNSSGTFAVKKPVKRN